MVFPPVPDLHVSVFPNFFCTQCWSLSIVEMCMWRERVLNPFLYHEHTHTHTYTCTHKHMHTHTHTHTYTHMHTYTHTHACTQHTHTHTHTQIQSHMHTLIQQTCCFGSSVRATDYYKRRQTSCETCMDLYLQYQ